MSTELLKELLTEQTILTRFPQGVGESPGANVVSFSAKIGVELTLVTVQNMVVSRILPKDAMMPENDYNYYRPDHLHGQEVLPEQIIQHQGKDYHLQRAVCVTFVPPYNQALYLIDKGVEAKIIELLYDLGPYCRISKHQWLVATDKPCEEIWEQLDEGEAGNVLVFAMLVELNWQFCCKPMSEIDEWEFDGVGVFFQQHLGLGDRNK